MNHPSFPEIHIPSLQSVQLPLVRRVRLSQPQAPALPDLAGAVQQAFARTNALDDLPQGAEVALAVGSRGVANIDLLAKESIRALKAKGLQPFIVPAMGSHGGGTAEGQVAVLAQLGVTEAVCGAPVRASMETVELGRTSDGIAARFDAHAAKAAAVVTIARVKSHTSFDRDIESGLTKMVAIGLGKQAGARTVHRLGLKGMRDVLPAVAQVAIANSPLRLGLAVVENANHQIVHLEAVPAAQFLDADRRLLKQAKVLLARLPFRQLDACLCEELGKEISGSGMDYAVTGRTDLRGIANPDHILITKLAILRLTEATAGNGIGVGVADFMPRAMANALDLKKMYENSITSAIGEKSRIPIVLPTEKEVLQATMATCWAPDPARLRYCQIKNTLSLDEALVSEPLWEELGRPGTEVPETLEFDAQGCLTTLV